MDVIIPSTFLSPILTVTNINTGESGDINTKTFGFTDLFYPSKNLMDGLKGYDNYALNQEQIICFLFKFKVINIDKKTIVFILF